MLRADVLVVGDKAKLFGIDRVTARRAPVIFVRILYVLVVLRDTSAATGLGDVEVLIRIEVILVFFRRRRLGNLGWRFLRSLGRSGRGVISSRGLVTSGGTRSSSRREHLLQLRQVILNLVELGIELLECGSAAGLILRLEDRSECWNQAG